MLDAEKNITYNWEKKQFIRKGSCNGCGLCCPNCPMTDMTQDTVQCNLWSELSDKEDNKEVLEKAGIHTSKCRDWPNDPGDLLNNPDIAKKCGYWFEEIK